MAVEKGQRYREPQFGDVYEILSDPFEFNGLRVAFRVNASEKANVALAETFLNETIYTLIVEPKFKVGDKVMRYGDPYTVGAVAPQADPDGEWFYLIRDAEGYFSHSYECGMRAAT